MELHPYARVRRVLAQGMEPREPGLPVVGMDLPGSHKAISSDASDGVWKEPQ